MSDNYIAKEEILSFVEELEKRTHGDDLITKTVLVTTKCVKDFVMHMPPEDVQPVVHGKWILCDNQRREDIDNGNYLYFCDQCLHSDLHAKSVTVSYCWNCGAKMRQSNAD